LNANPDDSKGLLEEGFHKTSDHPTISRRDRLGHLLSSVALMRVGAKASYPDIAKRNHVFTADHGSIIIRHLVIPWHVECCTKPIPDFIAETVGEKGLVNVMAQYYPANLVARIPDKYPDVARRLSREEIQRAYAYARALNLQFEQVS